MVNKDSSSYSLIREDELLPDPLNDRQVKNWQITNKTLTLERLFEESGKNGKRATPNTDLLRQFLMAEGKLTKEAFMSIMRQASEVLSRESNLLRLEGRFVMFGDIHGQFYDMCDIMRR